MRLETFALFSAVAFGILWLALFLAGLFASGPIGWPFGILGLIPVAIILGLLAAVIYQRVTNREDDYYDKNVDQ